MDCNKQKTELEHTVSTELAQAHIQAKDNDQLENLGYTPQLKRQFNLLSMVGFSFSVLTCWSALAGSLAEVVLNGGASTLVYGWIGVAIFSLFVALCLADLCSAYPVSGGQYSWCLILARDTKWGRVVSYICGYVQLAGILGMVAVGWYQVGINTSAMAALNTGFEPKGWSTALIGYASGILALIVDIVGIKILDFIAKIGFYWSISGFFICMVAVLACCPKFAAPENVFTSFTSNSGWSLGMAIIIGLMQAAFGMCCYDSVAHMSEEIEDAAKQGPRAMVIAIIVGFVTGFAFLLTLLFSIQDMDQVLKTATDFPLSEIFRQATEVAGGVGLTFITVGSQVFTNFAMLSQASRSLFAFARDGAFPGWLSKWLVKVHPTLKVPINSLLMCAFIAALLVMLAFFSSTAFFTVISIACTGLYISYLMAIVVYFIRRDQKIPGYYNLGKWTVWMQIPAIVYLTFCCVFYFFPTSLPVTGSTMNYSIAAFGILGVLGSVGWVLGGRKTYAKFDIIDGYGPEEIDISGSQSQSHDEQSTKSMSTYK